MNRRAVLSLVGCGVASVATVASGRGVARAACDASDAVADPRWVFPAGDFRIGIDSAGDRSARMIVFATATDAEKTFMVPPPAKAPAPFAWVRVDAPELVAASDAPETAVAPPAESDASARLVYDAVPGVTTYVDCCGIAVAGDAYVAATVLGTGPTYLVRFDPARGTVATYPLDPHSVDVVALYRRPAENVIRVVLADGRDIAVPGHFT